MRSWLGQEENPAVLKLALQSFGFYLAAMEPSSKDKKDLALVFSKVSEVLEDTTPESDWELADTALHVVHTMIEKYPGKALAEEAQSLWASITSCLSHPNSAVQLSAIKLLSMYLADFAKHAGEDGPSTEFTGSHGLKLRRDDIMELVQMGLGILGSEEVDETVARETVQILIFLGNYLNYKPTLNSQENSEEDEDEAEDEPQEGDDLKHLLFKLASIIRKRVPAQPTRSHSEDSRHGRTGGVL